MNLRRRPLVANAVALMVAPRMAFSQPTGKVWQIGSLTLYGNRIRQAAITKEIAELVGGSEALK